MRWRAAAVVLAVALAPGGTATPASAADPAGPDLAGLEAEGADLARRREELLASVARLTDAADGAHARLVAAQQGARAAAAAATAARAALVDHAVEAFIHGSAADEVTRVRGRVLAEVVGELDRATVVAAAAADARAATEEDAAASALADARRAEAEVADARRALEATIADHRSRTDAARAEEERNARARRLAEAEHARREAEARARQATVAAAAGTGPAPPRAAGAGPAASGRVARATAAQTALMAAHPFGPVTGLPPGMSRTGEVVEGMASWYGPGFDGRPTASGAVYDQQGWTVASKELPLGTVLLLTRGDRSVLALVNDRGPFVAGRVLDLSRAVAEQLGTVAAGVAPVRAEVVRLP